MSYTVRPYPVRPRNVSLGVTGALFTLETQPLREPRTRPGRREPQHQSACGVVVSAQLSFKLLNLAPLTDAGPPIRRLCSW